MLSTLFLILLFVFVILTILLWMGSYFFQGYIYTEPSQGLYWQAPVAALLLTSCGAVWCLAIAFSKGANPQNIPIDALFRFTPNEDMLEEPAKKMWAIKVSRRKGAEPGPEVAVLYESKREGPKKFRYEEPNLSHRPFQAQEVIALEIEKADGSKMRFDLAPTESGDNQRFVSKDGWIIKESSSGPTGIPERFNFGRLMLNLVFNIGHFACWFLALWVVLRFQWSHALGLAAVLWLTTTLFVLPMLLAYSGFIAASRPAGSAWQIAAPFLLG